MMGGHYYPNSKNHLSESVYQNKPCNWRPRLVFWESGYLACRNQPLSRKDGRVGANHRLFLMRQTLSWMRKKKKTAHHWWSGSGTDLPGWSTCSNAIPNRDGEDLLSKGKESGYEFKILLRIRTSTMGTKLLLIASMRYSHRYVCVICISTCIGSSTHWFTRYQSAWFFSEWQGAPAFCRYDFQLTTPWHLSDMTGFGKGVVFNLGCFWEVGPTTSLEVPLCFPQRRSQ